MKRDKSIWIHVAATVVYRDERVNEWAFLHLSWLLLSLKLQSRQMWISYKGMLHCLLAHNIGQNVPMDYRNLHAQD